jgi:hypothetical protein
VTLAKASSSNTERYESSLKIARQVLEEHLRTHGRLSRWDYDEILREHPELTEDDLDIQVARLTETGQVRQTTMGLVSV